MTTGLEKLKDKAEIIVYQSDDKSVMFEVWNLEQVDIKHNRHSRAQ